MKSKFEIVFKRLKNAKLDENILCSEFWRKVMELNKRFNQSDCWALMIDNIEWLINTGTMTTGELKSWFSKEELNRHNIYTTGKVQITDGFAIGLGNVKIEASGHSRIVLFDTAFAEGFDTAFIIGFHSSSFTLNNCVGEAFNHCKVLAKDFSKVEAWDHSFVKAESYSYVLQHEKARVEGSKNSRVVLV